VSQEIFDSVFEIIDEADEFILLDFFLVNDFLYTPGPGMRPLSRELTDRLIAKRKTQPEVPIVFITDPINTIYGSTESPLFKALEQAGVQVVWTDLDRLRDSNPLYSVPWRILVKPWGVAPGNALPNPLGEGRVSMRSMLKLLNFKANHRKLVVTEKSLLVASANPHSASSAHWNVGLRIDGAGQHVALDSEQAILNLSGAKTSLDGLGGTAASLSGGGSQVDEAVAEDGNPPERYKLDLLTEMRIQEKVVELLDQAEPDARIDLGMFYLSDRHVTAAVLRAKKRGCNVRVILDPNKDAFGRTKNGIPNRQTAVRLVKAGIPVRWAETHGEQFHVKMLYVEPSDRSATVLLGSCNFTRRNLDNFNAECSIACTGSVDDAVMLRTAAAFDRWWNNPDGRIFTTDYAAYADSSRRRILRAWLMEATGLSSF
jgi:phosphatidylserine/phosphatidylglycerophosphate/cardiolipin synthase-like enzyme